MRASNEEKLASVREGEKKKERETLRTHWRHIVEQRGSEREGVGGVGGFQSNPPFPSPRKFSGGEGTDWRRVECDRNESSTSDP